jgi:hypothetical protein
MPAQPSTPDKNRIEEAIALAEELKQRWTPRDERLLRIAAVLLFASFVLKGIHHASPSGCPLKTNCEQSTKSNNE